MESAKCRVQNAKWERCDKFNLNHLRSRYMHSALTWGFYERIQKIGYDKQDSSAGKTLVSGGLAGAAALWLVRLLWRGGVQGGGGTVRKMRK